MEDPSFEECLSHSNVTVIVPPRIQGTGDIISWRGLVEEALASRLSTPSVHPDEEPPSPPPGSDDNAMQVWHV